MCVIYIFEAAAVNILGDLLGIICIYEAAASILYHGGV